MVKHRCVSRVAWGWQVMGWNRISIQLLTFSQRSMVASAIFIHIFIFGVEILWGWVDLRIILFRRKRRRPRPVTPVQIFSPSTLQVRKRIAAWELSGVSVSYQSSSNSLYRRPLQGQVRSTPASHLPPLLQTSPRWLTRKRLGRPTFLLHIQSYLCFDLSFPLRIVFFLNMALLISSPLQTGHLSRSNEVCSEAWTQMVHARQMRGRALGPMTFEESKTRPRRRRRKKLSANFESDEGELTLL